MKKLLSRSFSLTAMLTIPLYYFNQDSSILKSIMLGNEFIHWTQLILFPLVIALTSTTVMKQLKKDKTKKGKEKWEKMQKTYSKLTYEPKWRAFMNAVDWICLAMLVFLLNDWSFAIILLISIFLVNLLEARKNELQEALITINKKPNARNKN